MKPLPPDFAITVPWELCAWSPTRYGVLDAQFRLLIVSRRRLGEPS
jgi:hypothetical protein